MVNLLGFVKDLPTRCHVCQGAGEIQEPETIAEPEELTTLQLVKPNYPELFALWERLSFLYPQFAPSISTLSAINQSLLLRKSASSGKSNRSTTNQSSTEMLSHSQAASFILQHLDLYQVCGGCKSVVSYKVAVCHRCGHYRFHNDQKTIIKAVANFLASPPEFIQP